MEELPKKMNKNMNVLKWVLVLGIVIVLNLFFNFAIDLVYDAPDIDNFCDFETSSKNIESEEICVEEGGAWQSYSQIPEEPGRAQGLKVASGYCDLHKACRDEFDDSRDVYNRNVFVILVILGLASLVIGIFTSEITAVSLGLSFGGVLSFIIASMRYWSAMDDILRVIILGLALAALIWVGIKKIRD